MIQGEIDSRLQTSYTNPCKATRDVQGIAKAKRSSLHMSHKKVPISGEKSLPVKLPFQHDARHRRSPWSGVLLRETKNKWRSFAPKTPSGRISIARKFSSTKREMIEEEFSERKNSNSHLADDSSGLLQLL